MTRPMTDAEIAAEQELMQAQQADTPGVLPAPEMDDDTAQKVTPLDLLTGNYVDRATRDARYAVCKSCDRLTRHTKQCRECWCVMPAKTWLADARCDLDRWPATT